MNELPLDENIIGDKKDKKSRRKRRSYIIQSLGQTKNLYYSYNLNIYMMVNMQTHNENMHNIASNSLTFDNYM